MVGSPAWALRTATVRSAAAVVVVRRPEIPLVLLVLVAVMAVALMVSADGSRALGMALVAASHLGVTGFFALLVPRFRRRPVRHGPAGGGAHPAAPVDGRRTGRAACPGLREHLRRPAPAVRRGPGCRPTRGLAVRVRAAGAAGPDRRVSLALRLDEERDPWLARLLPGAHRLVVVALQGTAGQCWLVFEHGAGSGSRLERRVVATAMQAAAIAVLAYSRAVL